MNHSISPFAPSTYPDMPEVAGIRLATAEAGIKYQGRDDVLLIDLCEGTQIAGVFTQSKCASAPVDWCKEKLSGGLVRGMLINSGNANAFTGMKGQSAVDASARLTADVLSCSADEVFLASTGVIGEPLNPGKFDGVLQSLAKNLHADGWKQAANAIMTTDTYPKMATRHLELDGYPVTLNGIVKGSGMIAPDMATMLGFLFTDAPISAPILQALLARLVGGSFNAITVDSDTSTSDTVLLCATGAAAKAGLAPISELADPRVQVFADVLGDLMRDLAQQIVKDGEGARKFVEVAVKGAQDDHSAKKIALSIANSPLVKTAIAGEDANWGRVVMAIGKAGEPADRDRIAIWFGDVRVATQGERDPDYSEEAASRVMQKDEVSLTVDLGIGPGLSTVWTCDLTKEYVAINGDYRS
ncbi:MAG: bifunctional glutamate N-acetyltransferase/amino-acid acetyltransferase ArgJ [Stappiaceae bacterium]